MSLAFQGTFLGQIIFSKNSPTISSTQHVTVWNSPIEKWGVWSLCFNLGGLVTTVKVKLCDFWGSTQLLPASLGRSAWRTEPPRCDKTHTWKETTVLAFCPSCFQLQQNHLASSGCKLSQKGSPQLPAAHLKWEWVEERQAVPTKQAQIAGGWTKWMAVVIVTTFWGTLLHSDRN